MVNGAIPGVYAFPGQPFTNGQYQVTGLTNGTKYAVFLQYEPIGASTSACVIGTPAPNYTLTELNGEGSATVVDFRCFIATAAYGTPLHPDLKLFRHFRDRVLLKSYLGKRFVHYYYKFSPPAADFIADHPRVRSVVRHVLEVPAAVLRWFDDGDEE
jgi:hypothetical protein